MVKRGKEMKKIFRSISLGMLISLLFVGCNSYTETGSSSSINKADSSSISSEEQTSSDQVSSDQISSENINSENVITASNSASKGKDTVSSSSSNTSQTGVKSDYIYNFGSGSAPLLTDPLGKAFLDGIFPSGGAPSTNSAGFTLTVDKTDFESGVWHSKWNEKDVFRLQLSNTKNTSNPYTIRIGKGGQLYSLKTKVGELMPPQTKDNAWVDDCLLLTFLDYGRNFLGQTGIGNLSGFIHQAGMYQYDQEAMKKNDPSGHYFSPIVAEYWDEKNSQYSCITLGMSPIGPSLNRGDVLMYTSVRDIGDGVFEMQYMTYNYNLYYNANDTSQITSVTDRYMVDVTAWGGHRKSVFPYVVSGNTDNSETYSNPFGENNGMPSWGSGAAGTTYMDPSQTGGWFAGVQNLNSDSAYAMSWIVGNKNLSNQFTQMFVMGDAATTDSSLWNRDFEVMNLNYRAYMEPGTVFYFRYYYSVGDIKTVAQKSAKYKDYCVAKFLEFKEESTPMIPLYLTKLNNQTVLTEKNTGKPAMYVYTQPVKNSFPLYLIRNKQSNRLHVTCDPYMLMESVVIENDSQSPKRTGFRPYDGTTEIVKLLGYVMPEDAADPTLSYCSLSNILTDQTYYPQLGIYDKDIVVRTTDN